MKSFVVFTIISFLGGSRSNVIPTQLQVELDSDLGNISEISSNNGTLIFAQVIFRHGERSSEGFQLLTNEGKRQQFALGQYFHRRYGQILGAKFTPEKVYVLSTDSDRAIMSAQVNLAGLFPPANEEEIWNNQLLWQPVPVHTIPSEYDILLYGKKPCPKYDALYEYLLTKSPIAIQIHNDFGHLYPFWEQETGTNISTIEDILTIYKKLVTDKGQGQTLPSWAEEAIKPNGPMEFITKTVYKLRSAPELVRIRCGFLLREMFERFAMKLNSTLQPDRSLWLYSAHSSTVTTMLNGLGFAELQIPPYACSIHFELYKTDDNKHYLQLFYRKPDDEYPHPLNVPGCGEMWTLNQFHSQYNKLFPGDYEAECSL